MPSPHREGGKLCLPDEVERSWPPPAVPVMRRPRSRPRRAGKKHRRHGVVSVTPLRRCAHLTLALILLIQGPQAVEQQVLIVRDLAPAVRDDAAAEAAGRNDGGGLAELSLHARDHAVEHGRRTENAAGAHGLDRVGADALFRRVERDVRQLRRAACERLE